MDKKEMQQLAVDFEKANGTEAFLKVSLSSVTRLLVEKGLCTEDELKVSFLREVNRWPQL